MQAPGRAAAATEVLDRVLAGEPAEKALTAWARGARYAGSKDRAAVRDLVYDALRQRRSAAALGGGEDGRALVLGVLRARGEPEDSWFDGSAHGPARVRPDEAPRAAVGAAAFDIPDWLEPPLRAALGEDFEATMQLMRERAPVILRVNLAKISRAGAAAALADEGIVTAPHPLAEAALQVTQGASRLRQARAFAEGLAELQDAASQAVIAALPLTDGMRVLDHCAGGGGKTLAMAARADLRLWAHDAQPRRMEDLKIRAARAGVRVTLTARPEEAAPFDLVLTDVPCSGSGSWRRDPEGKWRLTPARLDELTAIQSAILERAAAMVAPGGWLAYATCSFLREENEARVQAFLSRSPRWETVLTRRYGPLEGGDGFFLALLRHSG
ncbi:RsmB/NOP family class I SAM-dependent RNA methyltransferase [Pseudogemmobacter humi]|uniref:Ribosomal RNA small subunit methyltransferase B n=1 Tax=Pseudogemmobacter humi TaxID=2483812 RepID=A0A3P5XPY7_9RHOB|nr:RsmB/NOP family class I SAM-dependent RNA methyltransferase [Pseudogemmobacter humi]VDC30849.1 Ribosomal RNA small subunit methyltransferase B [Pseudogemmobacter humi]